MRKVAKTAFELADFFAGDYEGPRILIYHQVGSSLGREMEVPLEVFRRHLDLIEEFGQVVDLEAAIAARGQPQADAYVALVFDDGYADVYENAFPLLAGRKWPFTIYLTTEPTETGRPLDTRYPDALPLNWSQVKDMVDSGLALIGAHTHTHPELGTLDSDQIRNELDVSNRLIEDATGRSVDHFTYPWGRWSSAADPLVRERYTTATLGGGGPITGETDVYAMPRIPIQKSDGLRFFKAKLRTGLRAEDRIRGYLGRT